MIQIANAPCSWGVIENVEGERYDYLRVLDEMQETGYAGTELGDWGFMPTDPAVLTVELNKRNLQMVASWVDVKLHDPTMRDHDLEACVRIARLLRAVGDENCIIVLGNDSYADPVRAQFAGRVQPEHEMTQDQWVSFVEGTHAIAQAVKQETNLRTVLHPHVGTMVETPEETVKFLALTDPELVGIVFDTGHWLFAGGDPVQGIQQHQDRIWHMHFKDCNLDIARQSRVEEWDGLTSVGHGVFCELGKGAVDFPAVLATLREIGYDDWIVVEQDILPNMGTPKASAQHNRDYLKSIGV